MLQLISNSAAVERMVAGYGGKLKAPVVKQKSFEYERKGGRFFQADRERRQMDYPSLRWRVKSSSGSKLFWRENGLAVQVFRNNSAQP